MSVCNELRLNQELFDAVIRVDNVEFHVNKNILCECSEFFRGLFTRWSTPDERDFNVSMVTADMMKLIIEFAYTGSVSVTNENVEDLFKSADMLLINGIVEACCSFMEEHLTPQNCIGLWWITGFCNTPEMNHKVFSFIMNHFEEVAATSEEFLLLSVDDLVRIIKEDQLKVKQEEMVFEAVLRWITHKTEQRREHIHQLLSNVRLVSMSSGYLKDTLSNNELVRTSEGCQQLISMTLETKLHPGTQRSSHLFRPRLFHPVLLAVGGWNHNSLTNGIEAYDVYADRWVKIPDKDKAPCTASDTVFHNGSLYFVCGYDNTEYNTVQRFDLRTSTRHNLSKMYYRRDSPGVTGLDRYMYALGGINDGEYLRTAERYDPSTNQWTLIAPMNERRRNAGCTALNGKVYICGGFNENRYYLSSAECYDPATNQWTRMANMGSERCRHGVIAYAGRVFAVGGQWRYGYLNTAEAYDPDTNTWNNVPSMLEGCKEFGIEVIDDRLFVVGGDNGSSTFLTTVQCFDIRTGQWSKVCSMNIGRWHLSCCVVSGLPNLVNYAALRRSS